MITADFCWVISGGDMKKPDAKRVSPRYFTGSEEGDESLFNFLGSIGALGGSAKEEYEKTTSCGGNKSW